MSIDCHARVFQTLNDLCGHQSQEVHWKYIQKNTTRPWATAGRPSEAATIPGRGCGMTSGSGWAGSAGLTTPWMVRTIAFSMCRSARPPGNVAELCGSAQTSS
jgi:hypothetical protein